MGELSRQKDQSRRRGSAWRRCEQMGQGGGLAQPSGGGEYSVRLMEGLQNVSR